MNASQKDALCIAIVYQFADVACFKKYGIDRARTKRELKQVGLSLNDPDALATKYNELVLDTAADLRPDLKPTYDYWGAKCLHPDPQWHAPKSGTVMAGDSMSVFLPCVTYLDMVRALKEGSNGIL